MTRPSSRKGCGFTRSKQGRSKRGAGNTGRGTRGRLAKPRPVVGELHVADEAHLQHGIASPSGSHTSEDFAAALEGAVNLSEEECRQSLQSDSGEMMHPIGDSSASADASSSANLVLSDHDYCVTPEAPKHPSEFGEPHENLDSEDQSLLPSVEEAIKLLRGTLPREWMPFADQNGVHSVMVSRGDDKSIQRNIFVNFSGDVRITVHRRRLTEDLHSKILMSGGAPVRLSQETVKGFVDRIQSIVMNVRQLEVCAGQDYIEYEKFRNSDDSGTIDNNPYDENRYVKTFRKHSCSMLVPVMKWKCKECLKAGERFRHRKTGKQDFNMHTPNVFLNEEQKRSKLTQQQKEIKALKKRIGLLEKRVKLSLDTEGVNVDKGFSDNLTEILREKKLTPLQELFIQQQCKAASAKSSKGMRWHPTLIRFALLIKSESSAAYHAIKASGMITLPGDRTLFDYSHVLPKKVGVNYAKISLIHEKLSQLNEDYQHFHNLLFDEIHISQKLVYNKSSGEMMGYVHLDEVAQEMKYLVQKVNSGQGADEPPLATKILTFMIKGVANGIKETVASYPTSSLNKEDLYDWTWEVIAALEIAGVKVLSVVCDGNGVNRAFFDLHQPVTKTASGVVFDTTNLCAPDRKLHFISDVPHLLKTVRNAFAKTGRHPKCKKQLTKDGEIIAWSTIERLYLEDHENTWRQSHKLNAMNVYLNSCSCMKVSYAAQVLSKTVALDLKERKWPKTSQTVEFLLKVNDFFDCLNGAHSEQGKRTENRLLDPYTSINDARFEQLEDFMAYIHGWKKEVDALPNMTKQQKEKLMLPYQTVEGIEISIRAFISAVKFVISVGQGKLFINARVFCQDPLEQYFSKQRSKLGGSNNPNVEQFKCTSRNKTKH